MDKKTIKTEEGSALVLVMMVLLVLSVLGAALGVVTLGSLNLSENNQDINSAYYIAQAGANMAYEELKVEVDKAYGKSKQSGSESTFFYEVNNSNIVSTGKINEPKIYDENYFGSKSEIQPTAEVKIVQQGKSTLKDNTYDYTIKSTGRINGKSSIVEKPVEVNWKSHTIGIGEEKIWTPEAALIVKDSISAYFSTRFIPLLNVYGDIIYGQQINGHVNQTEIIGWTWGIIPITKTYSLNQRNDDWSKYNTIINRFPDEPKYENTVNPSRRIENLTISENTYIPHLKSTLFKNLKIDTKNEEVNIVVDNLEMNGLINIEVLGTGTVNFYVRDTMRFNGIGLINRRNSNSQINFLHARENNVKNNEENKVVFNGSFRLNASIFVKQANIEINGASVVTNGIISGGKKINLVGGHRVGGMIYAPNAEVMVTGGTGVSGIVLAENLVLSGLSASIIDYNGEYVDDFYYYSDDAEIEPTVEDLISTEPALEQ